MPLFNRQYQSVSSSSINEAFELYLSIRKDHEISTGQETTILELIVEAAQSGDENALTLLNTLIEKDVNIPQEVLIACDEHSANNSDSKDVYTRLVEAYNTNHLK